MHCENYVFISFQIEWDMIVMTVFLSVMNQMGFHLVQNRKENCPHDHIPFNLKGNGIHRFLSIRMCLEQPVSRGIFFAQSGRQFGSNLWRN